MGAITRREQPDIIEDVLENPSQYEFFQVLRLLEADWNGQGKIGEGLDKWLRMRPAHEISFPGADIRRCEINDKGKIDLEINFMGLYGVDAPVPHYFTELIARDDESSHTMREFLDIYSHRIYALFYKSWKKYRPFVDLESGDSSYIDYVRALSGDSLDAGDTQELAFGGTMGARVRNSASLSGMLSDYMGGMGVSVNEFVPRWVKIESEGYIGGIGNDALSLGDNTIVGDEVLDVSGKIDIVIGPVDGQEAKKLLPGKEGADKLGSLIERYMDPTLDFDLVILIKPSSILGMQLGDDDVMLGWSTWVGYQASGIDEIRIPGENLLKKNDKQEDETKKVNAQLAMVA